MLNLSFFNQIANNFRDHYYNLARRLENAANYRSTYIDKQQEPAPAQTAPKDSYLPSAEALALAKAANPKNNAIADPTVDLDAPLAGDEVPGDDSDTSDTTPVVPEQNPDGTYYMKRVARLDYRMDLQFDLAALTRTVEQIADGESFSLEQFSSGGFGLRANMSFSGMERIAESADRSDQPVHPGEPVLPSHQFDKFRGGAKRAGAFSANSRDFALNSFFNEASSISRFSNVINNQGHRLAINKFAMRFSMDSQFQFANLRTFNLQTRQMADQNPDAVNSYINSAGDLAASGSNEMMATFFDAVDQYLNGAEQKLVTNAAEAFDRAAAELGFSGDLVDTARDKFVATIESFFERVDLAISDIRTRFVSEDSRPTLPEVETEIPDLATDPSFLDQGSHLVEA
ncbi:MAG: hypothetical protein P1R58_11680 [bacterium]|nr:hypothetical protein [bacterium]